MQNFLQTTAAVRGSDREPWTAPDIDTRLTNVVRLLEHHLADIAGTGRATLVDELRRIQGSMGPCRARSRKGDKWVIFVRHECVIYARR